MNCGLRSPDLRAAFERDGYVVIDLLDTVEVAALRTAWAALAGDLAAMAFSSTAMSRDPGYRRQVHDRVGGVLGPAVLGRMDGYRFCLGSFLAKRPGTESGTVQWHQDWTFCDEDGPPAVGVWCPLTDVDDRNGCLRLVPGSHHLNRRPRGFLEQFPYPEFVPRLESDYAVELPLRAGQAVVYSLRVFHSSQPNRSDDVRVVAGGLLIPSAAPLLFLWRDARHPGRLAVHAVPDDFYQTYLFGTPPSDDTFRGFVAEEFEPVTDDRLRQVLGGRHAGVRV